MKGVPADFLNDFELGDDGKYHKKKTSVQPRDVPYVKTIEVSPTKNGFHTKHIYSNGFEMNGEIKFLKDESHFRTITLSLFGEPMPKQSVRSTKSGHHYQPQKMVDRVKDYQKQILEQLPKDFKPFEHEVHVTKFHCIYSPLKSFHKVKGKMDAIRNGEIFYKNTRPDLSDNLKKLTMDAMSGLVYKDDGLVVTETNIAKYYGVGGCILIELKGY